MKLPFQDRSLFGIIKSCLAVLGILFVTAFVVFCYPLFQSHNYISRRHSCESNMKQLGVGILQYVQDYDEVFPNGLFPSNKKLAGVGWAGQIYVYEKSTGVYRCPGENNGPAPTGNITYGYNQNVALLPGGQAAMPTPMNTVVLFETDKANASFALPNEGISTGATMFSPAGDGTFPSLVDGGSNSARYAAGAIGGRPSIRPGADEGWEPGRHTNGANYLMADGHVKWFFGSQVSSGIDAKTAKSRQTGYVVGSAAGTGNPGFQATFSVH